MAKETPRGDLIKIYESLMLKKKLRSLEDLYFFNKFVLEQNSERRDLIVPHVHGEWVRWMNSTGKRIKLLLVPRGTFKTTFLTVGGTLQQIAKDRNTRILIANATLTNAQKMLGEVKGHITSNQTFRELYGEMYDQKLKWNNNEIVVRGRDLGTRESTVTVAGAGGNLVSQHYNYIFCDDLVNDMNSGTRYLADKIIDWWKRSLSLLDPDGKMFIIGCLTADTKVLMSNGTWKEIIKVKSGEKVWSVDEKTGERSTRKVTAVVPQGKSKILKIATKRHEIKATPNHPFLILDKGELKWKRADELKIGEWLVTIKQVNLDYRKRNGGRYLDEDFYWLFGFLMGDGWVSNKKTRNYVCACYGINEKLNSKVFCLLEKYFGKPYKTRFGYYRVDSQKSQLLVKLGLKKRAKEKEIPDWIFQSRPSFKRAFIKGLLDADGCKASVGKSIRIELANESLIKDLKLLSLTCGVRPTSIYFRQRDCQPPHSKKIILSRTWSLGLTFIDPQIKEHKFKVKTRLSLDGIRVDGVKEVIKVGEAEVFDLTVEKTHNFIANGMVVHNTRWSYYELYSYLMEKHRDEIDFYNKGAYNIDGSLYFPERFSVEKLKELKMFHGPYFFSAFYLNDPVDEDTALIKKSQIKFYGEGEETALPSGLAIFTVCDPAVSQETSGDYSSVTTVGVDWENNWYVLEVRRGRWTTGELISELFSAHKRWKPITMSIEVIGQAQGLLEPIQNEEERQGVFLPLEEIKSRGVTSKEARIRSILQPRFENGKVYIKKDMEELQDELLRFPKSKHDDVIDSLTDVEMIGFSPDKSAPPKQEGEGYFETKLKEQSKPQPQIDDVLGEFY